MSVENSPHHASWWGECPIAAFHRGLTELELVMAIDWSWHLEGQSDFGQEALQRVGPVLDLFQDAFHDVDQVVEVGGGEVGQ